MGQLFGTNGVRGVTGVTLTPELALRLGRAVGTWLKEGDRVVIGRDARGSGPMLQAAFCAGLHAAGVHTVEVGILPTPALQLYTRDKKFAAGVVITASHNPPEYNGIKLVAPDGTETDQATEARVEAIHFSNRFRSVTWDRIGSHTDDGGAVRHYLEAIKAQVDVKAITKAKLTVVLDPGGGAGCVTAPRLLKELGVTTVKLSCTLDGRFSDRPSEPSPANATRCIEKVKETGADLGVLQDGDADRAIFIDEKGDYVWGDTSLALAVLHELRRASKGKNGAGTRVAVATVSTSNSVSDAAKMAGGIIVITPVGSPIVARVMMEKHAAIGGEDNGGIIFARHQYCRDSLMAAAFMLELLAKSKRPLSVLAAEIPRYSLAKDKIRIDEQEKEGLLARVRDGIHQMPGVRSVDLQDGAKAYFADGWVLLRPSGTEPIFRVQAESLSLAEAQAIVKQFKGWVSSLRRAPVAFVSQTR